MEKGISAGTGGIHKKLLKIIRKYYNIISGYIARRDVCAMIMKVPARSRLMSIERSAGADAEI